MLLPSLIVAGSLAAQAVSAAVIRPTALLSSNITAFDFQRGHAAVELSCPQCPFAGPDGNGSAWMQDQGLVKMLIEIDVTNDRKAIQVNGQPVFPPAQAPLPVPLTARQIRASDGSMSGPLRLGYALDRMPTNSRLSRTTDTGLQLFIFNVENIPLRADSVKIEVSQSHGRTDLYGVGFVPYSQSPGAGFCVTSACRLRAIIASHVRKLAAAARAEAIRAKKFAKSCCCSSMKRISAYTRQCSQEIKKWVKTCCCCMKNVFGGGRGGGSHGHGKGHHHHGGKQSKHGHFIQQTIHFVLLPALVGIMGGLIACSIGMLLGRAMAHLMNRASGRGAVRSVELAVAEDEKDSLVLNDESLPRYTDVDVVMTEKQ